MTENKTKATAASVDTYLASIDDESRRADCRALVSLMARASALPAVMWGTSIVGFGRHHYPLAGGKTGDICAVGFSSRKGDISFYGVAGQAGDRQLLAALGKHRMGKSCLYVTRLADIDLDVLAALVKSAIKTRHAV